MTSNSDTQNLPTIFQRISSGQVRWCAFGGVKKTRPVVIVGRDEAYNNHKANHVTVLPITRSFRLHIYTVPIVVTPNIQSYIQVDSIQDVPISSLRDLMGTIPISMYNMLIDMLKYRLDNTMPMPYSMSQNMELLKQMYDSIHTNAVEKPDKDNTKTSTNIVIEEKKILPAPLRKRIRVSMCDTDDLREVVSLYKKYGGTSLSKSFGIPYQTIYSKYISATKELQKRSAEKNSSLN